MAPKGGRTCISIAFLSSLNLILPETIKTKRLKRDQFLAHEPMVRIFAWEGGGGHAKTGIFFVVKGGKYMVYVFFFKLSPTMFKYDKSAKNRYVGKKIQTHKFN